MRPRRRRAGDAVRGEQHEAQGCMRPGSGPGGRNHRSLSRSSRPRHRAGHGAAAGLHSGHVRNVHAGAARLRHPTPARRAGIRHRLRGEWPSAGGARIGHHRHGRRPLSPTLANVGGGLSAARHGACAGHAFHQQAACRDLQAHPERGRGRRRGTRGRDRSCPPRLEPGFRCRGHRRVLPHQRGDGRERPAAQGRAHRAGHGDLAAHGRGPGASRLRRLSRA